MESIVSVQWLNEHINDPDLIILDASPEKTAGGEISPFKGRYIPGSRIFDIQNDFSDPEASLPNTMPSPEYFQQQCRKIGISQNSIIVVYDNVNLYTSPRAWWMFKAMGHNRVAVLDGGLPEWIDRGLETTNLVLATVPEGDFVVKFNSTEVKDIDFVTSHLNHPDYLIVDARSKGRFQGTAPEPREGLKSGHIPGSVNLPFQDVMEDGKFKPLESLQKIFSDPVYNNKSLVFTCGSGVSACIILLAADQVIHNPKYVYDGSWTEWASIEGTPIETIND